MAHDPVVEPDEQLADGCIELIKMIESAVSKGG
jgi:hypothetical protein